ncbi:hypothetical protein [Mycobacterium avium]|nr:hypothetical protein [Mycobacterium avium]ETB14310.1 hypothetical protein P863_03780 [Mycobacterium avium subsp. silvaticum ATCC 49884]ETB17457.1 hypothetical protein O972_09690 [Mycobacterium avium subsp. avium 10-9275]ETB21932.1 hypothetical protein O973_09260 [Mycobacterium avium subsp. avium 11-4751]MDV3264086.1 hypothetical protein [Mycobacterium avium]QGW32586.1 hypothetical protein MAA44156_02372 [Mycobacterium avium subsp. avium]
MWSVRAILAGARSRLRPNGPGGLRASLGADVPVDEVTGEVRQLLG